MPVKRRGDQERRQEEQSARQLSAYLDQLVAGQPGDELDPGLMAASARLAGLLELLPAAPPAFEARVRQQLQAADEVRSRRGRWWPAFNLRWLAPVAALLLLVLLVAPGPRQALSNWMAQYRLADVQVVLAPERTVRPELAPQSHDYATLAEAEEATGFHLLVPAYLPSGYALAAVHSMSYQALPLWLQPLYVETDYRPAGVQGDANYFARLRQFNASQSQGTRVGQIELQSEDVRSAHELTLAGGIPAVLLEIRDARGGEQPALRQLIWEQDGMTLELWSEVLDQDEMVRIARSLH